MGVRVRPRALEERRCDQGRRAGTRRATGQAATATDRASTRAGTAAAADEPVLRGAIVGRKRVLLFPDDASRKAGALAAEMLAEEFEASEKPWDTCAHADSARHLAEQIRAGKV